MRLKLHRRREHSPLVWLQHQDLREPGQLAHVAPIDGHASALDGRIKVAGHDDLAVRPDQPHRRRLIGEPAAHTGAPPWAFLTGDGVLL